MIDYSASPLSSLRVESDIVRAYLNQYVINAVQTRSVPTIKYEIKEDERFRPDLVSYRVYRTSDVRWLVSLLCDVEDEANPLPVGSVFYFPEKSWLQGIIKEFSVGKDFNTVTTEVNKNATS